MLDPNPMLYRILRPEWMTTTASFSNCGFGGAQSQQPFVVLALESLDEPSCQFSEG